MSIFPQMCIFECELAQTNDPRLAMFSLEVEQKFPENFLLFGALEPYFLFWEFFIKFTFLAIIQLEVTTRGFFSAQ